LRDLLRREIEATAAAHVAARTGGV
jgi:hypothetical protein